MLKWFGHGLTFWPFWFYGFLFISITTLFFQQSLVEAVYIFLLMEGRGIGFFCRK
jgi:hypothetical protein